MLSQFQTISDGRLGCTACAKHRMGHLRDTVQLVRSTPYHADLITVEFEEVEVENFIKQKILELVQSE